MSSSSGLSILQAYNDSDSDSAKSSVEEDDDIKNVSLHLSPSRGLRNKCLHSCDSGSDDHHQLPYKRPRLQLNCSVVETTEPRPAPSFSSPSKGSLLSKVSGIGATPARSPLSLPKVPSDICNMFSDTNEDTRPEDHQSQHEGRIRSFPHIRGNWASYVYIHCSENAAVMAKLNKLLCDTGKPLSRKEKSLHLMPEKHVSLSRTLSLRHHWIEPLTSNLKKSISSCQSFDLYFEEFDVYTNEEKSRTFISMKTIETSNLLDIVEKCDESLSEFQLEPYYKDPSFHVSCAWMLGDQSAWVRENLIPILNTEWSQLLQNDRDLQFYTVSSVEFKTGNQLYRFCLRKT